jgi:transcriptional regulator with XRE-family HTH domain
MRDQEYITPIDQYVIDFVRTLRQSKKLTQQDIADILRLSRSYISDVESNNSRAKYNIRHINALADYFELSPRAFFPDKPMPLYFPGREIDEDLKGKKAEKVKRPVGTKSKKAAPKKKQPAKKIGKK